MDRVEAGHRVDGEEIAVEVAVDGDEEVDLRGVVDDPPLPGAGEKDGLLRERRGSEVVLERVLLLPRDV
jgi:hypothetical protein